MSERDKSGAQEQAPVRVATREQFDEAVAELFRTGQPIEAPSLEMLDAWDVDPRWGGYRQIHEAGGHVRKGEKGTPIMYVDFRQRRTARDEQGNPVRDEEGRPKLEWVQRDRPLVKLHHVFNVEQTEGLKLRSLETAGPEWEGHERAEALIKASGVRVDHVAGDRAYYSLQGDRVVLPERSQFASVDTPTRIRPCTSWGTPRGTPAD